MPSTYELINEAGEFLIVVKSEGEEFVWVTAATQKDVVDIVQPFRVTAKIIGYKPSATTTQADFTLPEDAGRLYLYLVTELGAPEE